MKFYKYFQFKLHSQLSVVYISSTHWAQSTYISLFRYLRHCFCMSAWLCNITANCLHTLFSIAFARACLEAFSKAPSYLVDTVELHIVRTCCWCWCCCCCSCHCHRVFVCRVPMFMSMGVRVRVCVCVCICKLRFHMYYLWVWYWHRQINSSKKNSKINDAKKRNETKRMKCNKVKGNLFV